MMYIVYIDIKLFYIISYRELLYRDICLYRVYCTSLLRTYMYICSHVCHVYICYLLFNLFDSLTGGRTLLIANTSTLLKTAQLYEFQAETSQDKEKYVYVCQICKTMI